MIMGRHEIVTANKGFALHIIRKRKFFGVGKFARATSVIK